MSEKKIEFDFREGLDSSKLVYKKSDGCTCKDFWSYLGYLLATWCWSAGWFALFLYAWLTDRTASFIAFLTIWLVFMVVLIFGFFVPTLCKFYSEERRKLQEEKDAEAERERLIAEATAGPAVYKEQPKQPEVRNQEMEDKKPEVVEDKDKLKQPDEEKLDAAQGEK